MKRNCSQRAINYSNVCCLIRYRAHRLCRNMLRARARNVNTAHSYHLRPYGAFELGSHAHPIYLLAMTWPSYSGGSIRKWQPPMRQHTMQHDDIHIAGMQATETANGDSGGASGQRAHSIYHIEIIKKHNSPRPHTKCPENNNENNVHAGSSVCMNKQKSIDKSIQNIISN